MANLENELKQKRAKLQELIKSRSKAYCSTVQSTKDDVIRETEIEDLEDEIRALEEKMKKTK